MPPFLNCMTTEPDGLLPWRKSHKRPNSSLGISTPCPSGATTKYCCRDCWNGTNDATSPPNSHQVHSHLPYTVASKIVTKVRGCYESTLQRYILWLGG